MLAHLLALSGYLIPFANIAGPLVILLLKKDESKFIRHNAVEALNFQISMFIYFVASIVMMLIVVGFFIFIALCIVNIVFIVVAAVKASDGVYYRYPLCIRFVS